MFSSKDPRSFTNSEAFLPRRRKTPWLPAALSMIASMIHLWSFPDHFLLWWGYGAFFLAAALAQGLYAVALLRIPSKPLYLAGIWGNLALVALYVATRTAGIPLLGPHAGEIHPAQTPDLPCLAAELALISLLILRREQLRTALTYASLGALQALAAGLALHLLNPGLHPTFRTPLSANSSIL